jgi:hypothetical protein
MIETAGARLAEAAQRLEASYPGYLERVRRASARLAVRDPNADDLQAAIDAVADFSVIDLDVPTASRVPLAGMVKAVIERLISWYLGYFGRQLLTFGEAVSNLGAMLMDETETLSHSTAALQADVVSLGERVERLEQARHRSEA